MKKCFTLASVLIYCALAGLFASETLTLRQTKDRRPAAGQSLAGEAWVFDVTRFGAKGDGKALDTPAINRSIETAAAAGGGTGGVSTSRFWDVFSQPHTKIS